MPHSIVNRLRFMPIALTVAAVLFAAGPAHAQSAPVATFGAWTKTCETGGSGRKECFVFLNIKTKDGSRGMLNLTVIKVPQTTKPVMVVTVPLGIFLPRGLSMSIDGAKPSRIQIQICSTSGCQSQFEIPDAVLHAFKGGLKGTVTMYDPSGEEVKVPFSLRGFTKALASLG